MQLIFIPSIVSYRFYIDFSMNRLILGGLRDWLVFVGVECTQVFVFLLMYIAFVVNIIISLDARYNNCLFYAGMGQTKKMAW